MRWLLGSNEIRLAVVDHLPATVPIAVGEHQLRTRPLADIEADFPDVGRLMARLRTRRIHARR
jgi:hypothetical protein